ncbi:MAG: hypothetical protein LBF78_13865 [Treponema sp.]|jgi:hypothetical protein|nr:hypothetical protein [Treponema sp.]
MRLKFAALLLLICSFAWGQDGAAAENTAPAENSGAGIPLIINKPFVVFNEGISAAWLTKIVKKSDRSNFVDRYFMPGLYVNMKTVNMEPFNSLVRLALYYPLLHSFNRMPQYPQNYFHFAIDFFAGIDFELKMWHFLSFNFSPGLHLLFHNDDRWNYLNMGIGGLAGMELPISRRWTIFIDGIASFDNGNFGTNRDMEPFDIVYQYQLALGVRYSKRLPNQYPYIKPVEP